MRKLLLGLFCITTFIIVLPFKGYSNSVVEEEVKLYLGQAQIIPVSSPKKVAVGNPAIADIADISKTEITISPKSIGNTTLVVWDNYGEQSYRLRVFTEDTSDIKRRVDNMLGSLAFPGVYTKAEDEEGKVVILGNVKDAEDKDKIALALAQVKDKIIDLVIVKEEEAVIEIDVQVIELTKGFQDKLGFTWPGSITITEVGSPGIGAAGTAWGKLFKVSNVARTTTSGTVSPFQLTLDALIQEGKARILSRPRLSCQSGKEAKLVVGGEVPILSGTVSPGGTQGTPGDTANATVDYKDYGIILNIKPLLEDSGRIHLGLEVEVSELGTVVETAYALAYPLTKRTATTELFLDDGQTMAIGGLIKKKATESVQRVPWLSDIPVLGLLFRQKTKASGWDSSLSQGTDTELFITLTPRVVSQAKAQKELKSAQETGAPLISEDKINDSVLKYAGLLQKRIMGKLVYPAAAKESGFQGAVKLSLKLSAQGDLLDLKLKESSNYQILDDAALKTVQGTSPYPPFPPEIKANELWVDIPIIYQLE